MKAIFSSSQRAFLRKQIKDTDDGPRDVNSSLSSSDPSEPGRSTASLENRDSYEEAQLAVDQLKHKAFRECNEIINNEDSDNMEKEEEAKDEDSRR